MPLRESYDFPADRNSEDTMIDRAMRSAKKKSVGAKPIPSPETPQGKMIKRPTRARPTPPSTAMPKGTESPEVERGQGLSAALLKGAALAPGGRAGGVLRGILGGASVGLDIGTALTKYNQTKQRETAANAAMKMDQPTYSPPTPSNVPPDLGDNESDAAKKRKQDAQQDYGR